MNAGPRRDALTPDEEDQLLVDAIALAMDVRDDLRAAHLKVLHVERRQLERLAITLAAMVDPNIPLPVMAWWRHLGQDAA